MSDPIEESTLPFTGKYQVQAKRIERAYKWRVWSNIVLIGVLIAVSTFDLIASFARHDPSLLALVAIQLLFAVYWSRDTRKAKRLRAERYVRLTNNMAFDMSVQKLIEHEERDQ